jgi:hypothetical protein
MANRASLQCCCPFSGCAGQGTELGDNAFAVPTASGSDGIFWLLLDPIMEARLGLPSEAGHNTAIQTGKQTFTLAEHVIASER